MTTTDTPAEYRKRPVVITAMRAPSTPMADTDDDDWNEWDAIMGWCGGHAIRVIGGEWTCGIETLEGVMTISPGDWVIRGVQGEHYPCKPAIFDATYEAV